MRSMRWMGATFILFVGMAVPASADVDAQALYDKKCKVCHTLKGVSGPMAKVGGTLDGVGSRHDGAWLRAYLADPTSKVPDSKAKMKLSPEEVEAMAQFLSQQK